MPKHGILLGAATTLAVTLCMFSFPDPWTIVGDNRIIHFPLSFAAYRAWSHGHIPGWTVGAGGGYPVLADPQAGALYLPDLLIFALVPASLVGRVFDVATALHAGLLSAGVVFLLELLGVAPWLASIGAVLTLLCPLVTWWGAGFLPQFASLAWWPWLLAAAEMSTQRRNGVLSGAWILGCVALAAQIFAGYPEHAIYSGLVAGAWVLCCGRALRLRERCWRAATLIGSGIVISAPQIVPTWLTAPDTIRGNSPHPLMSSIMAVHPSRSIVLASGKIATGFPAFLGLPAIGAALVALCTRRPRAGFLAAVAAVTGVFALGSATPLYEMIHGLPVLNQFRGPMKAWSLCEVTTTWAAILGIDALRRRASLFRLAGAALLLWIFAERLIVVRPWLARQAEQASVLSLRSALSQLASYRKLAGGRAEPPKRMRWVLPFGNMLHLGNLGMIAGVDSMSLSTNNFETRGQVALLNKMSPQILDALGVDVVFTTVDDCQRLNRLLRFRASRIRQICVLQNPSARPRYETLARAESVDSASASIQHVVAYPSGPTPVVAPPSVVKLYVAPPFGPASIEVMDFAPGDVLLRITTPQPRLALLREVLLPGWHATVDGVAVPVYPAGGMFFAVPVAAGRHLLNAWYRPPGFSAALSLPLVWLVTIVVLRRRAPESAASDAVRAGSRTIPQA